MPGFPIDNMLANSAGAAPREASADAGINRLACRFCNTPLRTTFVDLGMSPLCQTHIAFDELQDREPFYPLHAYVCERCLLVQLPEIVGPTEIFAEYAYFSSYSTTWVEHARCYVEAMIDRFGLSGRSKVIEIASNDGYLLQHFVERGVPVLGIEPAANVAKAAIAKGIPTEIAFLGPRARCNWRGSTVRPIFSLATTY